MPRPLTSTGWIHVPLSSIERKQLRARAHSLKPVILVGDAGMSEGLLAEADRALDHHELIKIRLPASDRAQRSDLALTLCRKLAAEQVQAIGRVLVIFRKRPETETGSGKRR